MPAYSSRCKSCFFIDDILQDGEVWSLYVCNGNLYAKSRDREYGYSIKEVQGWAAGSSPVLKPAGPEGSVLMRQAYQMYKENFE